MAEGAATIYLGFLDEAITEKHKNSVNFTTNKIGGLPDYPSNTKLDFNNTTCPLCQLPRPLIAQIYAPLDDNVGHRVLYVYGCINPNCWNNNESWCCIRVQSFEKVTGGVYEMDISSKVSSEPTDWCVDADDWGNDNVNEENGNIGVSEKVSDEDDESYSFDESVCGGLKKLNVDDTNANWTEDLQGGAVGRLHSPSATAEIEGDEGENITIDTPTLPQRDVIALLQEAAPLPQEVYRNSKSDRSPIQFIPYFINVYEEVHESNQSDRHIRELLQEYQKNNGSGDANTEGYEKGIPRHGDRMFHHFLTEIQKNPGQILRYSRENKNPLLLRPLKEIPQQCQHCQGEMIYELQILPTIIPKLRLTTDARQITRLEFGNVLIFTCQRSCWSTESNYRQEIVVVQAESY